MLSRRSKATLPSSRTSPGACAILDYASWLEPAAAAQVEEATERLLNRGEAFSICGGQPARATFEISGRPVSGNAVMRIRDVSGDRLELAQMRERIGAGRRRPPARFALALESAAILAWGRDVRGALGLVQRTLRKGGRSARTNRRPSTTAIELFDPSLRREAADAIRDAWGLEAPRERRRQRRAPNLRSGRGPNRLRLGRHRPRRYGDRGVARSKWSATRTITRA